MKRLVLWILRLVAAGILMLMGYRKLIGDDMSVLRFETLGMDPHGWVLIGIVEVAAALLLVSPLVAAGALLAVGVMLGAIIAHTTVLGADVGGDGGRLLAFLVVVFVSTMTVLLARRQDLPLIGSAPPRSA